MILRPARKSTQCGNRDGERSPARLSSENDPCYSPVPEAAMTRPNPADESPVPTAPQLPITPPPALLSPDLARDINERVNHFKAISCWLPWLQGILRRRILPSPRKPFSLSKDRRE